MNFPDSLKYTKDHEWIRIEGTYAVIGITDFAQSELGDIVYVEIETAGETLDKEVVFGTIEAVKTVSDLFMPVSGKIIEVNKNLVQKPESVNKDPYQEGWMIKIEMTNAAEADALMTAADYSKRIAQILEIVSLATTAGEVLSQSIEATDTTLMLVTPIGSNRLQADVYSGNGDILDEVLKLAEAYKGV